MEWTNLSETDYARLEANLNVLRARKPEFAASLGDALSAARRIEISRRDGVIVGVRRREGDGAQTQPLVPPETGAALAQEQRRTVHTHFQQGRKILMVAGVGGVFILGATQEALRRYPTAAILFDRNTTHWAAALALNRILDDDALERLYLFGGDRADAETHDFLRREYLYLLPTSTFAFVLGLMPVDEEKSQSYISQAKALSQRLRESAEPFDRRASVFFEQAQTPLNRPPRSVWACTSRRAYIHFPLAGAFLRGFERLGLSIRHFPYDSSFTVSQRAIGDMIDFSPEMIFSINVMPASLLESIGIRTEMVPTINRPRVCWLVDDTSLYEDDPQSIALAPEDRIYCIDRSYIKRLLSSMQRASFLPPATQFEHPGRYDQRYAAPISYVGSLPAVEAHMKGLSQAERELLFRVEEARSADHHKRFSDHWEAMQVNSRSRYAVLDAARKFCATTHKGFTRDEAMLEYFLYNSATYIKRKRIVEALLPLGLRVFGPDAWREALPIRYKERYGGFVESADLADAYASAKLSINIHSHQCPTCLNPRDFDVPGAGGVVLGDWVADAERGLLQPGREMLTFKSVDEAAELAAHFLKDDDVREAVRQNGMERVRREHTYELRAAAVMGKIDI